jgi:hypothetical protein
MREPDKHGTNQHGSEDHELYRPGNWRLNENGPTRVAGLGGDM